jgi:hypothetical protein
VAVAITVNGRTYEVSSPLTYDDGVRFGLWRDGETVTYQGPRVGDKQRAGILAPKRGSVDLEEGMRFSTAFTGSA